MAIFSAKMMLVGAFFLFYGTRVMQDAANTHTLRYMSAHVRLLPSLRSRASPANFDIHNTNLTTVQNVARGGDHGTIPWLPATQQHTGTTPTPTHTHIHGPSWTLVQRETQASLARITILGLWPVAGEWRGEQAWACAHAQKRRMHP